MPLSECKEDYFIHEHSDNEDNWYVIRGCISFTYNGCVKKLCYVYDNVMFLSEIEPYANHRLRDMVETETTFLTLDYDKDSMMIMRDIIKYFGCGWLAENDSDTGDYYFIQCENALA